MIRRVKKYVCQDVLDTTGPGLALAVAIFDFAGERTLSAAQIICPRRRYLVGQRDAIFDRCRRPYWHALWLLQNSCEPELLGGKNVGHASYGVGGNGASF